jgi:Sigma-70 region 2
MTRNPRTSATPPLPAGWTTAGTSSAPAQFLEWHQRLKIFFGTPVHAPRGRYPMMENPPVSPSLTDLLTRATNGDQRAWDALVDRYAPLIWSICRKHNLSDADARNTGQAVWLQLVSQLGNLREPAALAAWLATTTRQEYRKPAAPPGNCRLTGMR